MKLFIIFGTLFLIFLVSVVAYPNNPAEFTTATPERRIVNTSGKTADAWAGNITRITIDDIKITSRWQGYYGNISGAITLDDADNNTLIDWQLGSVEGEIYAANATVSSWSTIHCVNFTSNGTVCPWRNSQVNDQSPSCVNLSKLESFLGISEDDTDGVNETFNSTLGSLAVGIVSLSNCPMVNLYVNDSSRSNTWNETMLTLNDSSDTLVYAAIVNDDAWGFQNQTTWDFQMIVGDNGDDDTVTTYYFYVELS